MKTLQWTSAQDDSFERGLEFGQGLAPAIENTIAVYRRMFSEYSDLDEREVADLGRATAESIAAFRPRLAREIEGIAAGSGQPAELIFAINARTELLSSGHPVRPNSGECSTVGVIETGGKRAVLAQTWDFHPDLAASRVVWRIRPASRLAQLGFTEAGIVAKLGVNEKGVAVGINFLATDRDSDSGGVPVHVLVRAVLEEAETLAEAHELVAGTTTAASVCMTVAGPEADGSVGIASIERTPEEAQRRSPEGSPRWLVHTNHFLEPISARDTLGTGPEGAGSRSRYEQLVAAMRAEPSCEIDVLTGHLSTDDSPECGQALFRTVDPGEPWLTRIVTLATVAFEVPSAGLWLRDGEDPSRTLSLIGRATDAFG